MLKDLTINLLAALIGYFVGKANTQLQYYIPRKGVKWFWALGSRDKIFIYLGEGQQLLEDSGEIEPQINLLSVEAASELQSFLKPIYKEVIIARNRESIDFNYPVVSIGGPLQNSLTKDVGQKGLLSMWFHGLPYSKQSIRYLSTRNKGRDHKSEFDSEGQLETDVCLIARLESPENPKQFIYVIAGNYGMGTLGGIKFLTSPEKLNELCREKLVQVVVRSRILHGSFIDTQIDTK